MRRDKKVKTKQNVIKWILLISLIILVIRILVVLPAALEHHINKQLLGPTSGSDLPK